MGTFQAEGEIMRKIITISVFICLFFAADFCYAMEWRLLHEKADAMTEAEALEYCAVQPSSLDRIYLLGLVYLNVHKDKQAQEQFNKMLSINPDSVEAQFGIAEVLRRLDKLDESQNILDKAISLDPNFWPAYIALAYINYTNRNFQRAMELAGKVVAQGRARVDLSNYTRGYLIVSGAKGMLANSGGPFAKIINGTQVLPNLKKAESLEPNSPPVLFGLGSFYFLAPRIAGGDIKKAQDYFERAIKADPLFADAYVRLAQVYKMQGNREKYQGCIDKALEIEPENKLAKDFLTKRCDFICVTMKE